jgi:conjugative relaxase-like TrwC/TraI family protein
MLRVTASTSSSGAKRYFGESLTRDDNAYYHEGQEVAGLWGGKAAERLGLLGPVDQESYFALCDNRDPASGERLTPRQKENRRVGYDWTFSAPKAVSVLYELTGDERILEAFQNSYRETLRDAEAEMKTRVRAGGKNEDRLTGNMAWAEFNHFTARPVDGRPSPHLHAHCFVFNTTWDDVEKRWKASQQGDLKRDADYWEAAFHTRFAKRLNDLGYATVKKGTSFTLAGVPQSLTDKFSERRNEIEREAAAKGIIDPKGKHEIGYYGREHKTLDQGKAELRALWAARLSPEEREALEKVRAGGGSRAREIAPREAIDYSLDHSFERVSAISEKRLQAEALRYGVGSVLPEQVNGISKRDDVAAVDVEGQRMMTTKKVLSEEVSMLKFARDGHDRFKPYRAEPVPLPGLSEEQRVAAQHVLQSRDRVTGLRGGAGTGKTRLMKETIAAIENSSAEPGGFYRKVFVFAPSAQASRGVLRSEGFANAETLERLLVDEKLQKETRGQVLWVDEAGMVSSRSMQRLFEVARNQECRIILSGDYRQHASVEAGDSFRLLESEAGVRLAELRKIRRQTEPQYRQAVEEISRGTAKGAQKGFDRLDRMGAIVEATGDERHKMLVADYLEAASNDKSALIIAPTHVERDRLTNALREALHERDALGKEREFTVRRQNNWTNAQKQDARNYEAGMVVEFQQATPGIRHRVSGKRETSGGFDRGERAVVISGGDKVWLQRENGKRALLPAEQAARFQVYVTDKLGVAEGDRIRITKNGQAETQHVGRNVRINNGDIFTVEGFTKRGDIRLSDGKVLDKNYGHFAFGYVDTSYASQGKTVDRVFIATGAESLAAAGKQQWYVSVSRGREACKLYVDSKEDVRDAIARKGERMSAVELVGHHPKERATLYDTLMERNRLWRFVKERAAAITESLRNRVRSKPLERGDIGYGRS